MKKLRNGLGRVMDGWIIHTLKNMVMSVVVEQKTGDKFMPEKGAPRGW